MHDIWTTWIFMLLVCFPSLSLGCFGVFYWILRLSVFSSSTIFGLFFLHIETFLLRFFVVIFPRFFHSSYFSCLSVCFFHFFILLVSTCSKCWLCSLYIQKIWLSISILSIFLLSLSLSSALFCWIFFFIDSKIFGEDCVNGYTYNYNMHRL